MVLDSPIQILHTAIQFISNTFFNISEDFIHGRFKQKTIIFKTIFSR